MKLFHEEEFIARMHVLSRYQINCKVVCLAFKKAFPHLCIRESIVNRTSEHHVETVTSCQVLEDDLMIFSARNVLMSERPTSTDSVLTIHLDRYVMATFGRSNLIIIASMICFHASFPNWEAIINHFSCSKNSWVYKNGNNLVCLNEICDFLFQFELNILLYFTYLNINASEMILLGFLCSVRI